MSWAKGHELFNIPYGSCLWPHSGFKYLQQEQEKELSLGFKQLAGIYPRLPSLGKEHRVMPTLEYPSQEGGGSSAQVLLVSRHVPKIPPLYEKSIWLEYL